jgi:hypothetical protein
MIDQSSSSSSENPNLNPQENASGNVNERPNIGPEGKDRRTGSDRRDSVVDRRSGLDRRDCPADLKLPNMERRRGAGIRRPEERRSAEEGELTNEQFEFVLAIEEYKRVNKKTFPTWTEVLDVIKLLGYRREMPEEELMQEEAQADE